jgi:hypothetical protein
LIKQKLKHGVFCGILKYGYGFKMLHF